MFIIVALVIWAVLKQSMGEDSAKSLMGKIILGYVGVAALIGFFSAAPGIAILLAGLIGFGIFKKYANKDKKIREEDYGWNTKGTKSSSKNPYSNSNTVDSTARYEKAAKNYSSSFDDKTYKGVSAILPKAVKKRANRIREFSEEFKLYLTQDQIDKMVNATYLSENWKREVESMNSKYYEIPSLWFQGPTRWLRAYLYAFTLQDVTSDWNQQERIAQSAFEAVFQYSDSLHDVSFDERIRLINDRFYTQFDDVTFMIAYNYLKELGLEHNIDSARPIYGQSKAEELEKKYASMDMPENHGPAMERA